MYSDDVLNLYLQKKLSREKMKEIFFVLQKNSVLRSRLDELSHKDTSKVSEISLVFIKNQEIVKVSGAVNFLRQDKVLLKGLPHTMTHSKFSSKHLSIGITRTENDFLLSISAKESCQALINGTGIEEILILDESVRFLRLPMGIYQLICNDDNIALSLA